MKTLLEWRCLTLIGLAIMCYFPAVAEPGDCDSKPGVDSFLTQGWGMDSRNTRFQPQTSINKNNVASLNLSWVFALDEGMSPHSYPLIGKDSVFIGTEAGKLYALDKESACVRWVFSIDASIRTAITLGSVQSEQGQVSALFFGTFAGEVFAVNAVSGKEIWHTDVRDHPLAVVTGTPAFYEGRLYVPVSSMEVAVAISPFYGCCTFSGSLLALNANTGEKVWRRSVIADAPKVVGKHFLFVEEWGPSGAPVWSAPTIDAQRKLVYFGTGENYSRPASTTSDSIFALDLQDGEIRWSKQFTERDAFNMSCTIPGHPNCPEDTGPDLDFGAPPIITETSKGRGVLLAGQKSGDVYALDPETGARLWSARFGRGGYLGGIHWGMAVNEALNLLYVPISDVAAGAGEGAPQPGLNALDIETGKLRWSWANGDNCKDRLLCRSGMSAAITATKDLVFAGSLDGNLHAYDAASGEILWSVDTWQDYESSNGISTHGGSIDVHGPVIAGDMLFIQSGYATFGQQGGNALLAFKLGELQ